MRRALRKIARRVQNVSTISKLPSDLGDSSLREWWKLDETSGNRVGYVSNTALTPSTAVTRIAAPSVSGYGVTFTGSNYLYMEDSPISRLSASLPLTIAGAIRFNSTGNFQAPINRNQYSGGADTGIDWDIYTQDLTIYFRIFTNAGQAVALLTPPVGLVTGVWYRFVVWHDPATQKVNANTWYYPNQSNSCGATPRVTPGVRFSVGAGGSGGFASTADVADVVISRSVWPSVDQWRFIEGMPTTVNNVVWDGNSFVAGAGASTAGMLARLNTLLGTTYRVQGFGVSGQTTTDMNTDVVMQVDSQLFAGQNNWCLYTEMTNDLFFGKTPSETLALARAYCSARKAAGWRVGISDVITRPTQVNQANIDPVNAGLAADFTIPTANPRVWLPNAAGALYGDFLYRASTEPVFATTSAGGYSPDQIHPNDTGHAAYAAAMHYGIDLLT